jgi:SAM-dependent methyltransferase
MRSDRNERAGTDPTTSASHWERQADAWAAWARTPDHDSYWHFNRDAFLRIVPPAGRRTLDLGCGEGRLSRDLGKSGHRVVGIDPAPSMVRLAREADPGGDYLVADGADLPFEDHAFDLVVAFNSLMDVDDLEGTVREAWRVLQPGGRLAIAVTHPINDAGRFESREPDARFVIEDTYFGKRRWEGAEERDGLRMHFLGWAYPLETYGAALESCGLLVETIREPIPDDALVARMPLYARWQRVPLFLHLRAVRPSG